MSSSRPTIVLVHGAWHGAWCWQRVVPLLTSRQYAVRTVELPSVGAGANVTVGLARDAEAVRAVIDEVGGPVLLCGHSYGGIVKSQASYRRPRVSKLVYLCAFVPESGESMVAIGGGQIAPWIQVLDGGLTLPDTGGRQSSSMRIAMPRPKRGPSGISVRSAARRSQMPWRIRDGRKSDPLSLSARPIAPCRPTGGAICLRLDSIESWK